MQYKEKYLEHLSVEESRKLRQTLKLSPKTLIFDIDGTLVNGKKELTEKTKSFLLKAQSVGHRVILASGRPFYGLLDLAKTLELEKYQGYLLSYNGGKIIDCQAQNTLYEALLPQERLEELFLYCKENGLNIISYVHDKIIAGIEVDEYIELESRLNHLPIEKVDNFLELLEKNRVNKCLLTANPELAEKHTPILQERFSGLFSVYRSDPFFVEIMPLGVDKGQGLKALVDRNILAFEDLIAFGDSYNDLTMLDYVPYPIAMGNGKEEVKSLAKYITKTNEEDGVYYALKTMFDF